MYLTSSCGYIISLKERMCEMRGLEKLEKIERFANLLEDQQVERLHKDKLDCQANIDSAKVSIKEGKKYFKVDVGTSGKYMVDF